MRGVSACMAAVAILRLSQGPASAQGDIYPAKGQSAAQQRPGANTMAVSLPMHPPVTATDGTAVGPWTGRDDR